MGEIANFAVKTKKGNLIAIRNTDTMTNKQNKANNNKSIPFKYYFTGFVSVKDVVNDLPIGIKVFNTQDDWSKFTDKSFPYNDIPLPVYSGGIDFEKDSLIYYSDVDAKEIFMQKHGK